LIAWHSEYLLSPISSETQVFREEWFPRVEIEAITDWDTTVAACDPSPTQFGDYKAIVVMSTRKDDPRVYVRYVWCRKATVEDLLSELHHVQDVYDCTTWIEDNAVKDFLKKNLRDYEKAHRMHFRIMPVHHQKDKKKRIGIMQSPAQRQLIVLPFSTHSDVQRLGDQLFAYPTAKYDDAPDAMSEAYLRTGVVSQQPAVVIVPPKPPPKPPHSISVISPSHRQIRRH
jgi:predicted phage terminase large subunit-like protein